MTNEDTGNVGDSSWTPAAVAAIVANPFNAIQIDPSLAVPHETIIDEESWVGANAQLIEQLGPTAYLRNLLVVLKGGVSGEDDELKALSPLLDEFFDEDDEDDDVYLDDADIDDSDEDEDDRRLHAVIEADVIDSYVKNQILGRLESEPGLVARAIADIDEHGLLNDDLAEELEDLETDPVVLRDALRASRTTWNELDPDAPRLLVMYLVNQLVVGPPGQPVEDQVTIDWRVPPPTL